VKSETIPATLYSGARFTSAFPALGASTVRLMAAVWVMLPDLAVRVTVDGPVAADAVTLSVSVTLAAVGPLPNEPRTPEGRPEKLTVTEPAKPFRGVKVRMLFPVAPCAMLSECGEAVSVKVGPDATVNAMVVVSVRPPDLPVIVIAEVPAAAVLAAAKVSAVLPAVTAPKVAVTPVGRPEADNVTVPLKPDKGVMAILLVPLEPGLMLKLAGVAARVKLGGGLTVSAIVALLVNVPEVPVMVTVDVPAAAVLAAVRVSVLLLAATAPKVAVTPDGRPDAASAIVPVNPFKAVMAMLLAALEPWLMLKLAGVAARMKFGCGTIVSAMATLPVRLPDMPVIVTVAGPVAAFAAALNVAVLLRADEVGLNVAVTPEGKPVAERVTALLNPFVGTTKIVLAPLAPGRTLRLVGDAVSAKLGGAATVKLRAVVLRRLPDVPAIVRMEVPSAAEVLAVRVSVPGLAVLAVLKEAVTPVGRPDAARATVPVKPFCGAMVMVLAPVAPR